MFVALHASALQAAKAPERTESQRAAADTDCTVTVTTTTGATAASLPTSLVSARCDSEYTARAELAKEYNDWFEQVSACMARVCVWVIMAYAHYIPQQEHCCALV